MNTRPHSRPSAVDAAGRFRVGDLDVDLGRVRVSRDGHEIALPRLSFDLLVALARVAPNVATYEELMQDVWTDVIVGPETVSQRVRLLREALGDDARESRYVAAVRGRGYRLVPDVVPLPGAPATAPAPPSHVPPPAVEAPAVDDEAPPTPVDPERIARRRPDRRTLRVAVVAAAALAAVALIALVAWRAERPVAARDDATSVRATRSPSPAATVAVLPFELIGPDAVEPFVARGIAEMVLNRLSDSRSLAVVARSSSFALDARGLDAVRIGQRLGARYLVQGGVQRTGDRLRVTVQLVDANGGRQLDAMRFDTTAADLFALQDEIAAQVAAALDVEVSAAHSGTRHPEAHLAYLEGLELLGRWRVADAEAAVARFARASRLDPSFAGAYVGEANARMQVATLRGVDVRSIAPQLSLLVDRALALDPKFGGAWVLRGRLTEDRVAAERWLRHGIELSPSDAAGHLALGEMLSVQPGREEDSLQALSRAIGLDPLQPRPRYVSAIVRYQVDGSDRAYRDALRDVLSVDPTYPSALTRLGLLEASVFGRLAEGAALLERALASDPTARFAREAAANVYLALGEWDAAAELVADSDALGLAVALARGRQRTAAELALPDAAALRRGAVPASAVGTVAGYAAVIAVEAEALRTGRIDDGIAVLRAHHCRRPGESAAEDGPNARPAGGGHEGCVKPWTLPAATAIAHLEAERGNAAAAAALANAVLAYAESEDARRLPFPFVAANRARALAVLGRRDDVLRALESTRSARAGNLGWWLVADHDPAFASVRDDPRFRALFDATRRQVEAERAALAAMRSDGRVPQRPAKGPARA